MAEVSITNKGLARIVEVSMKENFKNFNQAVYRRTSFRDLKLDRSQCKRQTIKEALSSKDTCYGLPHLDEDDVLGLNSTLRPFTAEISQLQLNQLELALAGPVTCEALKCKFEIGLKKLDISGQFRMDYSDSNEAFVPPTKLSLQSNETTNIKLTGEINIDPSSGKLNNLVIMNDQTSKINYGPGSLAFDMSLKKPFASEADKKRLLANAYRRLMTTTTITEKMVDQSYQLALFQMTAKARRKIDPDMKKKFSDVAKEADQLVDQEIVAQYGSKENFKKSLSHISWPQMDNDEQILNFLNSPPKELVYLTPVMDKLDRVGAYAMAENAGFKNDHAYLFATLSETLINKMGSDPYLSKNMLQPFLEKEILPLVHDQVNTELRNLKGYWDHLAKVPNLDINIIKKMSDLQSRLARSESELEKDQIRREIIDLTKSWESSWLPLDTEVLVDQNTRQQRLIKALVTNKDPACKDEPRHFSDDDDDNFDLRTELGPKTIQEYFNKLAEKKHLEICIDSTDPENCKGGTKVKLNKPPQISCVNGELKLDFDAEASMSLFSANVGSSVQAKIQNCKGDPCFQLSDGKGHFKNVLLNTFFGDLLQRGLTSAVKQSTNAPINIPFVQLDKLETNPKNCKSKLDWQIRP